MSDLHFCCGDACPGLPFRASERVHPRACLGHDQSHEHRKADNPGPNWRAEGELPSKEDLARITGLLVDVLEAEATKGAQQIFILAHTLACCAIAVGGATNRDETAALSLHILALRLNHLEQVARQYDKGSAS